MQAHKSNAKSHAYLMLHADEAAKSELETNGIKIGFQRLTVVDLGPIPICYHCGGYKHSASRCTEKQATCYCCAEKGHTGRECPNKDNKETHKCINCSNYNKKRKDASEYVHENHRAGDKINCSSYEWVLKNFYRLHKKE